MENAVPISGDQLAFAAATRYTVTNNISGLRVDSITFTDGGYVVFGNGITVTNGIISEPAATARGNEFDINITLGASQTFRCGNTNLSFLGQINLGTNTLTVDAISGAEVMVGAWAGTGLISGTGGITKEGPGTLNFAGWSVANTYSGPTYVKDGTLLLGRTSVPSIPGPGGLIIGDGTGISRSAVVRYAASDQIGAVPITIDADGLLDLAGNHDTIDGSLTMKGGTLTLGVGGLDLNGDVRAPIFLSNSTIDGREGAWDLPLACNFDIGDFATLYVSARIYTGGITKSGTGTLCLMCANSFGNPTIVQEGVLEVWDNRALGLTVCGTVVSNNATLSLRAGMVVTNEALTLNGSGSYNQGALDVAGAFSNAWAGPITLATDTVIGARATNSVLNLMGNISGSGGLTKIGFGTLIYSGNNNSYSGSTRIHAGTLLLDTFSFNSAFGGPLVIGVGAESNATVRLLLDSEIPDNVPITVNPGGVLNLDGWNETIGSTLTLNGGDVLLGAATLTLNGGISVLSSASVINGPAGKLNLAAPCGIEVASGVLFDLQAPVIGPGGLTKSGAGILRLGYPNSHLGLTVVQAGILEMWTPLALGATSSGTVVSNNATLQFRGNVTVANEPLTLSGSGAPGYGALRMWESGTSSWTGPITLASDSSVMLDNANGQLRLGGIIQGPGGLTKTGSGTLVLEGTNDNTYAGVTRVNSGKLRLAKSANVDAVPGPLIVGDGSGGAKADVVEWGADGQAQRADVVINSSGLVSLTTNIDIIRSLTGSGNIDLGGSGYLRFGSHSNETVFSGSISGTGGAFVKDSSYTVTLAGNSTYSGVTRADYGTLLISGSQPFSPVEVSIAAGLGGTGTVGSITAAGHIFPGTSPGILTCSNLTFQSHGLGLLTVELYGPQAGIGYDQIRVRGTVSLSDVMLSPILGFPSAIGNSFMIIDNDGTDPVNGTFTGLPEGATVNVSGTPFRISYAGGSGNDVVLTQLTATQRPALRIARSGATNVVLLWPTNFYGYVPETTTNPTTNAWSELWAPWYMVGTNYSLTNPASGLQRYYRLRIP